MTTPTIATCPRCEQRNIIFVRSDDGTDLVCQSCRGSAAPQPPTERSSLLRQPFLSYTAGVLLHDLFWEKWARESL